MFDVMSQARNAMESYTTRLKAITSNITNMSVAGFKRTDVSFQDLFSRLISNGTSPFQDGLEGGTNPIQLGGTAAVASSSVDFSQGAISGGGMLDLAIERGSALFVVSSDGGNTFKYTRAGEMQLSSDGNKVLTKTGYQLYGFRKSGGSISAQLVPIDLAGMDIADRTKITWDENGSLRSYFNSDTNVYGDELGYQVALVNFMNPSGLRYEDGTTFSESLSSGPASEAGSPTPGTIKPRSKEQSNVTYTSEIVDSLEMQRSLDASLTVIRMANDTISQFINKLSG